MRNWVPSIFEWLSNFLSVCCNNVFSCNLSTSLSSYKCLHFTCILRSTCPRNHYYHSLHLKLLLILKLIVLHCLASKKAKPMLTTCADMVVLRITGKVPHNDKHVEYHSTRISSSILSAACGDAQPNWTKGKK